MASLPIPMICFLLHKNVTAHKQSVREVVVVQLKAMSLPIPENPGSNLVIINFYWKYLLLIVCRKDENKEKIYKQNVVPMWHVQIGESCDLPTVIKDLLFHEFYDRSCSISGMRFPISRSEARSSSTARLCPGRRSLQVVAVRHSQPEHGHFRGVRVRMYFRAQNYFKIVFEDVGSWPSIKVFWI